MTGIVYFTEFAARAQDASHRYGGPERRAAPSPTRHWLAATLDEIDYGMLLLTDETQVMHINHSARAELDAAHPLQLLGRDRKSTRLNSSHSRRSRMPSSA